MADPVTPARAAAATTTTPGEATPRADEAPTHRAEEETSDAADDTSTQEVDETAGVAAGREASEPDDVDDATPARRRAERAGRIHGLGADEVDRLEDVFDAQQAHGGGDAGAEASDTLDDVVQTLQDAVVAEAFLGETLTDDPTALDALASFATQLLAAADTRSDRARRAAPLWLQARVLDRRGDVLAVEPLLTDALAADPTFSPALELAARYASDRGDAREAVRLLRAAGVPDDDEYLVELTRMIPKPRHDIGRNDPCWCGSGRKYKQCHLNRTTLDLDERAYWLYRKAAEHIGDGPQRARMLELATALRGEDELTAEAAWMALTDPIVADLVLIHDGAWDEFLAHRGPLLPDDERQLAQQWATAPQSVFAVTAAPSADHPLELRDERSGASYAIGGFEDSGESFPVGQQLLGRVVSTSLDAGARADTLIGGLLFLDDTLADDLREVLDGGAGTSPEDAEDDDGSVAMRLARTVGHHHRIARARDIAERALAMQDDELAAARSAERPRLVTSEGEPLVFCTTTYAIPPGRADEVVAALDASPVLTRHDTEPDGEQEHDPDQDTSSMAHLPGAFTGDGSAGAHRWREEVEAQGASWIRGTVTVDGDVLVLNTNAEPRHDRLVALLAELAPDLHVEDEARRAADEFSA